MPLFNTNNMQTITIAKKPHKFKFTYRKWKEFNAKKDEAGIGDDVQEIDLGKLLDLQEWAYLEALNYCRAKEANKKPLTPDDLLDLMDEDLKAGQTLQKAFNHDLGEITGGDIEGLTKEAEEKLADPGNQ